MKTVNALAFRKKFGAVLDEVAEKKETITITRANKPVAVLVPVDEYEEHFDLEKRSQRIGMAIERAKKLREELKDRTQGLDSAELIRQMRDERDKRYGH